MKKLLLVTCAAVGLMGCDVVDPSGATLTLSNAGYSDIKITGFDWLACGREDWYHTGFIAKGPTGAPVKGVVCKGYWMKAATIRFEN